MIIPYYSYNNVELYIGDTYQVLTQLKYNFNAIITDPPYAIQFEKNQWDNKYFDIGKYAYLFYDKLIDNGNLIMFQGWSNVNNAISSFSNFYLNNWIIWDRIKGRGSKNNFVSTRQDILWLVKNKKQYTYNPQISNIKKKTGGSIGNRNGCQYRKLSNVWTDISPIVPWSEQRVKHPTQKPIKLMERIIQIFTNENDIVLDPFAGSGSTGIACMNLNRKCVLIQKEEKYCEIIKDRIIKNQDKLNEKLF